MKKNVEIRTMAREKGVYLYEIADLLKVSEPTFNRWLRKELTEEKKGEVIAAIEQISEHKKCAN